VLTKIVFMMSMRLFFRPLLVSFLVNVDTNYFLIESIGIIYSLVKIRIF